MGTCFAKITHSGKIHLQITCVDHLAKHALHKVWLKASAENSFLYGNHVTKQGLGRITDAAPQHGGVVVFNLQDAPLGFGILAQPTARVLGPRPDGVGGPAPGGRRAIPAAREPLDVLSLIV